MLAYQVDIDVSGAAGRVDLSHSPHVCGYGMRPKTGCVTLANGAL